MRPLLLALLTTLLLPPARALEIPGSDLWAELILGQVDANGDTSIDGAEWSDGLAKGFEALDRDLGASVVPSEIDAVKDSIARTLGETGGVVAVILIKKLMKLDGDSPAPYTRETFDESGRALFTELDRDASGLIEEAELKALPVAMIRWLR